MGQGEINLVSSIRFFFFLFIYLIFFSEIINLSSHNLILDSIVFFIDEYISYTLSCLLTVRIRRVYIYIYTLLILIYIYIYIYRGTWLSFGHVWLNDKDIYCLFSFIKILSSFLISVLAFCFLNSSTSQFYPTRCLRNFVMLYKNLKNSFKDAF